MAHLKIGIVEDDLLIAESIAITLQQIGYSPLAAVRNVDDAISMIEKEQPDLILIDIMLDGEKDGIDLAGVINSTFKIPFVFLTANSDKATVERAKLVKPFAYLVKPFESADLFAAIEIAFNNFNALSATAGKTMATGNVQDDFVFVKEADVYHKIKLKDITYLEIDNVYLIFHTLTKKCVTRLKMDEFLSAHPAHNFFKVHRSFAINLQHLDTVTNTAVWVAGVEIPISKANRDDLLAAIKSIR